MAYLDPGYIFRVDALGIMSDRSKPGESKMSDTNETEDLSTGIATPTETTIGTEDAPKKGLCDAPITDGTFHHLPRSSWWRSVDSTTALFTPISTAGLSFSPSTPSLPDYYHKNYAIKSNDRPMSFDVAIHAAHRVHEGGTHAVVAADKVAAWAWTHEPPYTNIDDGQVNELLEATEAAAYTMRLARRVLLYSVKPVANLGPLWDPKMPPQPASKTKIFDEELQEQKDAWWHASTETQDLHSKADSIVRSLHRTTKSGRTSWRKETQKIVELMESVREDVVAAKKTWSEFVSGGCKDVDVKASALLAQNAVQKSAEACQQLVYMADATASAVASHRFWQWGMWIKNKESTRPVDAGNYLRVKMEAKESLDKAKVAMAQALVAAKATKDYK